MNWKEIRPDDIKGMKVAEMRKAFAAALDEARDDIEAVHRINKEYGQSLADSLARIRELEGAGPRTAEITPDQAVRVVGLAMMPPEDHGPAKGSKRQAVRAIADIERLVAEQVTILARNVHCEGHRLLTAVVAKYRDAVNAGIFPK